MPSLMKPTYNVLCRALKEARASWSHAKVDQTCKEIWARVKYDPEAFNVELIGLNLRFRVQDFLSLIVPQNLDFGLDPPPIHPKK